MALESELVIPHSAQDIIKAYADRDFNEHLSKKVGAKLVSFEVVGPLEGPFEIITEQSMSAEKLPEIAKKVIKGEVSVHVTHSWGAPDAAGSRRADTAVKISSAPVSAQSAQNLHVRGATETLSTVRGDVNVSIPIVGKKIKAAAEPYMRKFVDLQAREVSAWISSRS
ncbi:proteinase inhibitor I25 cystatin [Nesterenkonia sp. AN1]|uniref:Uncharacterized protein DUF2505 n=1 Tax=Nesterenkonia aurantiaca TaxID=1436010 RepID=A0A4R7G5L0_9MICC|nr:MULTISPECIES: DUF2505 domain-containing protein [Nesterenkonia]EXF24162.1 proteinase inhibitor I25 cystatin [Nesterenkonia sp. AN1]TDS86538.1 uncharacterized protein DUF2505 [Nesterenkonia aurantiaca]